ncbi:hypothetical protein BJ741DRAFT_612738 [Chytriomyces cf. hyalinus JEL632]|nr:hypothetical protein BJ741DRAFT_612738 [Chytriomyces cf. hyalinus JEL632]
MLSMNNTSTTRIETQSLSKGPPTILGSSAMAGLPFLDSSLLPLSQLSPLKQTPYSAAFDSLQSSANDSANRPQSSAALSMHNSASMSIPATAPTRVNSSRRSTTSTNGPSSISISSVNKSSSTNGSTPAAPLDFIGAASVGNQHSELFYFDHNQMITEDSIFPGIGALDFESMFANDRAEQAYDPFGVRVSAPSKPPKVDVFGGANVDETSGQLDLVTFSFDSSHDFDYPITAGSSATLTQGRISNAPSISNTLNARSNLFQTENGRNAILPPTQQSEIFPPIVPIHEDRRTNINSSNLTAGAGLQNGTVASSATVSTSQRQRIHESKTPTINLSESVIAAPDVKQPEKRLAIRVAPLSPPTLPKLKLRLRTGNSVISSKSESLNEQKKADDQRAIAAAGIQSLAIANQKEIVGSNSVASNAQESRILQQNPTVEPLQENADALPEKLFVASQPAAAIVTVITPVAATVHESAPIHQLAVVPSIMPAGITQKPIIAPEPTTKHDPHSTHVSQDLKKSEPSSTNLPIESKPSEAVQPMPAKAPIPTPPFVADAAAVVPQNESQGKRAKRGKRQIWAWVPVIPAEVKPVDLSAGRSLRTRTSDAHERASTRTEVDGIEAGRKAKRRKSELPVVNSEVGAAEMKVESSVLPEIAVPPVPIIPDGQLPQVSIPAVAQLPKEGSLSMSEGQNALTPSEVKPNGMPTPIVVDTVPNAPDKPVEIAAQSTPVIGPPAPIPAEAPKRSGVCHSCKTPGKLLDCTTCLLSYHFTCVEEGLEKNLEAQKKYICNRCQFMQEDDIIPEQPTQTQLPQSHHILSGISAAMARLKDSGALRSVDRPKGRPGRPPKSQKLKIPKPNAPTALSTIPTAIAPLIASEKDPSSLPVSVPPIPKLRVRLAVRPTGSSNLANAFESEPRPEPGSLPVNTVYRITESKIKRDFFAKVRQCRANSSSIVSGKAMSLERYKRLLELERNAHESA